jgi:two-component system, NarL family, response regulator LiaR
MNNPIRVVIVDDHPIVRAGMRAVLQSASDICVVSEGECGDDALSLYSEHRPDVLVLDVNLPGLNGVEVTRRLHRQDPTAKILILTVHDDSETIFGLLEAGATSYVLKVDALETLATAVRAAARGESWLSPGVAGQVLRRAMGEVTITSPFPLTMRETDVLRLLAQGLDNDAIAERLALTKRTVQNHVSAIYGKLGVTTRTEAVLYAIQNQLVQVPSKGTPHDVN